MDTRPNLPEHTWKKRLDLRYAQVSELLESLRAVKGDDFDSYASSVKYGKEVIDPSLLSFLKEVWILDHESRNPKLKLKTKNHKVLLNRIFELFGTINPDLRSLFQNEYDESNSLRDNLTESFSRDEASLFLDYDLSGKDPVIKNAPLTLDFKLIKEENRGRAKVEILPGNQAAFIYLPKPAVLSCVAEKRPGLIIVKNLDKKTIDQTVKAYEEAHETKLNEEDKEDLNELYAHELADSLNLFALQKIARELMEEN